MRPNQSVIEKMYQDNNLQTIDQSLDQSKTKSVNGTVNDTVIEGTVIESVNQTTSSNATKGISIVNLIDTSDSDPLDTITPNEGILNLDTSLTDSEIEFVNYLPPLVPKSCQSGTTRLSKIIKPEPVENLINLDTTVTDKSVSVVNISTDLSKNVDNSLTTGVNSDIINQMDSCSINEEPSIISSQLEENIVNQKSRILDKYLVDINGPLVDYSESLTEANTCATNYVCSYPKDFNPFEGDEQRSKTCDEPEIIEEHDTNKMAKMNSTENAEILNVENETENETKTENNLDVISQEPITLEPSQISKSETTVDPIFKTPSRPSLLKQITQVSQVPTSLSQSPMICTQLQIFGQDRPNYVIDKTPVRSNHGSNGQGNDEQEDQNTNNNKLSTPKNIKIITPSVEELKEIAETPSIVTNQSPSVEVIQAVVPGQTQTRTQKGQGQDQIQDQENSNDLVTPQSNTSNENSTLKIPPLTPKPINFIEQVQKSKLDFQTFSQTSQIQLAQKISKTKSSQSFSPKSSSFFVPNEQVKQNHGLPRIFSDTNKHEEETSFLNEIEERKRVTFKSPSLKGSYGSDQKNFEQGKEDKKEKKINDHQFNTPTVVRSQGPNPNTPKSGPKTPVSILKKSSVTKSPKPMERKLSEKGSRSMSLFEYCSKSPGRRKNSKSHQSRSQRKSQNKSKEKVTEKTNLDDKIDKDQTDQDEMTSTQKLLAGSGPKILTESEDDSRLSTMSFISNRGQHRKKSKLRRKSSRDKKKKNPFAL